MGGGAGFLDYDGDGFPDVVAGAHGDDAAGVDAGRVRVVSGVSGAVLLDLHDPGNVIAHLPEPLLVPEEDEREGYVPNVLYTCGGMVHRDTLVLPYAFSDVGISVALVRLPDLLDRLDEHRCAG